MKWIFIGCVFFSSIAAQSQRLVKGVVLDAEKQTPVPSASVFLNNTSIGTTASADGSFRLLVPEGRHDLIVSSVGYQTYLQTITTSQLPTDIKISLALKAPELETIVVTPFEKNGWANWGQFFLNNFIGTTPFAGECKLKNPKALRFRNSTKENELTVIAMEPLVIENKALGYRIKYQLESFSYNFKTRILLYAGYPFFEKMDDSKSKLKRWANNREETYYGSMLHFMRAVFQNKIKEEGYEVRRLKKVENAEKKRVRQVYRTSVESRTTPNGTIMVSTVPKDSSGYYSKVMQQEDYFDVVASPLLTGDSIAYAVNDQTAGLEFEDYLLVIYTKKTVPVAYKQQFPKTGTAMMSQATLINSTPIEIQANGSYYNPADFLTSGYWAWSEKIAMMLPFDFSVKK
jgi:hypothetical protein